MKIKKFFYINLANIFILLIFIISMSSHSAIAVPCKDRIANNLGHANDVWHQMIALAYNRMQCIRSPNVRRNCGGVSNSNPNTFERLDGHAEFLGSFFYRKLRANNITDPLTFIPNRDIFVTNVSLIFKRTIELMEAYFRDDDMDINLARINLTTAIDNTRNTMVTFFDYGDKASGIITNMGNLHQQLVNLASIFGRANVAQAPSRRSAANQAVKRLNRILVPPLVRANVCR